MKTTKGNSSNNSLYYELFYTCDSISLKLKKISNGIEDFKSRTFIKINDEYYVKNTYPLELNDGNNYNLILSKYKDTIFSYSSAGNINHTEIKKISKSLYKSTFQISGISNFKEIIYFNEDYKIIEIYRKPGNEEYIFVIE